MLGLSSSPCYSTNIDTLLWSCLLDLRKICHSLFLSMMNQVSSNISPKTWVMWQCSRSYQVKVFVIPSFTSWMWSKAYRRACSLVFRCLKSTTMTIFCNCHNLFYYLLFYTFFFILLHKCWCRVLKRAMDKFKRFIRPNMLYQNTWLQGWMKIERQKTLSQ